MWDLRTWEAGMETMVGIAALLVGAGALWLCFALGVYFFTRMGREGMRLAELADESRAKAPADVD